MAKRQFTEEELAFLRRNPYTAYVDENTLSFTVPFKIEYMRLHNKGVPPREILPRLGYPIEENRVWSVSLKKYVVKLNPNLGSENLSIRGWLHYWMFRRKLKQP